MRNYFKTCVAVLGMACAQASDFAAAQKPGTGPATVSVATVVERTVLSDQTFVGTIVPLRRSIVGSAVGGRVVEFQVNEGDRVTKGQPLAQLLRRALEIERDAAKAALEVRRQELKEFEAGSRPEELEQARAKMAAAKALMEFTKSKLDRTTSLFQTKAASQEQLQDDSRAAEGALQVYLETKAAHDLATAGQRPEKIAQAKAQVAAAEEEVNRIEDQLEKHTIKAPFNGYVVRESTEVGQWIASGDPVAEVVEVDEVDVEVPVLENYVARLRVGAPARVEIAALAPHPPFDAKVALVVPQADLRSRSFPVKVRLKNEILPDGTPLLKPGMFARVALGVGQKDNVLLVPKDALVLGGDGPRVVVVEPDAKDSKSGVARSVRITIGVASNDLVEITGGLKAGQQVVVEGNERLRDGETVSISRIRPDAEVSKTPEQAKRS